ncbi:interleukin-10 receptor subunit beta-like [Erpetoichthys calabaricus]|uniref:Interleukin-10 receptor subunit beta-like n=1 Tax=Erpetoichthys calabaricus TaxID=27687 RepID=A0A8C4XFJ2_ERPCA|nr:interleukin-10 receptor subunit beta-like [Erpetoichthys calabaricus]XP_051782325.1 interleukin-10 receptor subunit beta-like [Erpetoichthys calabaricus]
MASKSVFWILLLVNETFRGLSKLQEPTNVIVKSVNLKSVLHWDASPDLQGPVTYHVEYKLNDVDAKWTPVENCVHTTRTECNFSVIAPYYCPVVLQVRADNGSDTSAWVQSKAFCALHDTEIGPPTVSLDSQAGEIYVRFSIPGDAMKEYFTQWIHSVTYWKEGDSVKFSTETKENFVQLTEVESGVRYCVQVTSQEYQYNPHRAGISSPEQCLDNTKDEVAQVTSLVLILAATLVFACLLTAACFFVVRRTYGCAKDLLNPVWSVPEDIAEFLTHRSPGDSFTPPDVADVPEEAIDRVQVLDAKDDVT